MIKNLSPYYVTIPFISPLTSLTCTSYTMQLFVWNGSKSTPPTEPVYEFTKQNPTGSNGNSIVDIANLVSDFIQFSPQEGVGTELINGNNQVWVKWITYYETTNPSDATTPSNTNTKLSLKGYGYGLDGENTTTPTNKILLKGNDFKVSRNSVFVLPIEIDETTIVLGTLTINSIVSTGSDNYDLDWSSTGNLGTIYYQYRLLGDTVWTFGFETMDANPKDIFIDEPAGIYEIQLRAYDNDNAVTIYSNIYELTIT